MAAVTSTIDIAPDAPQNVGPVIVQASKAPVFMGQGAGNLVCKACGQVLVEGYEPRRLIALNLQCGGCNTITRTALWPRGEPLPQKLVTMGDAGHFWLSGPIDISGGIAVTCNQEIARVAAETGVRPPPEHAGFEITPDGLSAVQTRLNLLSDGAFEESLAKTDRAIDLGNDRFPKYPLAWAVSQLRRGINRNLLKLQGADGVAIVYLQIFLHLVARWQHHPLFALLSKALVHEFHHTMVMLTLASYLADHGNRIGFTDPGTAEGRSPDLFINLGPSDRAVIEVKAPTALQWPNSCPSAERLEGVIEKHLKVARGQITSKSGGIVVVGSLHLSPGFKEMFEGRVESLITRGKVSSRMVAVGGVCLALPQFAVVSPAGIYSQVAAYAFVRLNPRFKGPSFLRV